MGASLASSCRVPRESTPWVEQTLQRDFNAALLDTLHAHALPAPSGSYDSLVDYDRQRVLKEQLLYTTIATTPDMTLAVGTLLAIVLGVLATVMPLRSGIKAFRRLEI